MFFASDNGGPVHPDVMAVLAQANSGYAASYGADPLMDEVRARLREIFEAPQAAIYLVATGTAANALALATLAQPWQSIYCTPVAHILTDECNAPEFYTGGIKLSPVPGGDRMDVQTLGAMLDAAAPLGVHSPQAGPVSVTQVTECGTVYTLEDLAAISAVAKAHDLPVHLDGARFANALVTLGCTPAQMTWKAGIDAVSFGGTKNGLMGVEAVIFFDPRHAWEFELRRKRGAHLFSKHRYLSAQMAGYLRGDLWLETARAANANARHLADGLRAAGAVFDHDPQANMLFVSLPRGVHQRLHDGGAIYGLQSGTLAGDDPDEMLPARLVCDWSITLDEIDRFLALF